MKADDEYPPEVDYPAGHGPMCPRDCDHPCHEPYNDWETRQKAVARKARRQARKARPDLRLIRGDG